MKRYIKSNFDAIGPQLKKELEEAGYNYMQSQGFTEDEAKDWFIVEIENFVIPEEPAKRVEVRAELSYDGMFELSEILDSIIQKYDPDSYFDMVTSGIMEAVLYSPEYRAEEKAYSNFLDDYFNNVETLKYFIDDNLVGHFVSDDGLSGNIELEIEHSRDAERFYLFKLKITYDTNADIETQPTYDYIYYFEDMNDTKPFTYEYGDSGENVSFATVEEVIDFLKSEFDI